MKNVMHNHKIVLSSLLAVALLAGGVLTAYGATFSNSASDHQNNNGQAEVVNGNNSGAGNFFDRSDCPCSSDRHEAMEKAFENNDYQAWKEMMGDRGRVSEVVNKDNFDQFQKMHEAMEAGNYDKASQIREDLGLNPNGGHFQGNGNKEGNFGRGHGAGCPMMR